MPSLLEISARRFFRVAYCIPIFLSANLGAWPNSEEFQSVSTLEPAHCESLIRQPVPSDSDPRILFQAILDTMRPATVVIEPEGEIVAVNEAWRALIQKQSLTDLDYGLGMPYLDFLQNEFGAAQSEIHELGIQLEQDFNQRNPPFEKEIPCEKGEQKTWILVRANRLAWDGAPRIFLSHKEITGKKIEKDEKKRREAQRWQDQKLEAIGTLARGIAHDFNNILAAISGYTELSRKKISPQSKTWRDLDEVIKASNRAKDLVKQILTFSRPGKECQMPTDMRPHVEEALKLLRSSLPSTIEIRKKLAIDLPFVLANSSQIHQIVMNLGVNAAHAMKNSTKKILEVQLEFLKPAPLSPEPASGILRLSVRDTGAGMAPEVTARIFEPFFTTKNQGESTGLGLSVVHGIVSSHRAKIRVSSQPGRGTSFQIDFPALSTKTSPSDPSFKGISRALNHESVLLVDDEPIIADMGKRMLESIGYRVTIAYHPLNALEIFSRKPSAFDIVVTDLTMPKMTGFDLAQEIRKINPGLPVVIVSGYLLEERMKLEKDEKTQFLKKPFELSEISEVLRRSLDR